MKKSFVKFVALALVLIMVLGAVPVSAASKTIENAGSLLNDMFGWLFMPIPQGSAFPEQEFLPPEVDGVTVTVRAPEGALPAGTDIEVAPVDMAAVQNAVDASSEVSGTVLAAVDITFRYRGEEIQPTAPVTVTMTSAALDGQDNLTVVHIDDQRASHAESVFAEFEEDTATFDADKFSVYAVIDDGDTGDRARLTVKFYNGETVIDTAYITPANVDLVGNIIPDPTVNQAEGDTKVFCGWIIGKPDYDSNDVLGDHTINYVRSAVADRLNDTERPVQEGEVMKVYAMFFNYFIVSFLSENGDATRFAEAVYTKGNSLEYYIDQSYNPELDGYRFVGWQMVGTDTVYPNKTTITIMGDTTFRAKVQAGRWLIFEENPDGNHKGATYNPPVFCEDGVVTSAVRPSNPTLPGYNFEGWYTDKNFTTEFNFNQTIQANTTVYAKWTKKTTAQYTILIWQQNLAGDGYDFVQSIKLTGTTDAAITTINPQGSGNSAYVRINGTDYKYTGFYYDHSDVAGKTIACQGTTVVNVFFNRIQYTLTFLIPNGSYTRISEPTANDTNAYVWGYTSSGSAYDSSYNIYTWTAGYKKLYARSASSSSTSKSWYFKSDVDSEGYFLWVPYTSDYYGNATNSGRYYEPSDWITTKTIEAGYGQYIGDQFPITGSNGTTYNHGERWYPTPTTDNFQLPLVYIETMPNEDVTFRLNEVARPVKTMVMYVEALPGTDTSNANVSTNGEPAEVVTYNGKAFVLYNYVSAYYNGVSAEDYTDLPGFEKLCVTDNENNVLTLQAQGSAGNFYEWDTSNNATVRFYYLRKEYKILYQDGSYFDGNQVMIADGPDRGYLGEADEILYQSDISSYDDNYLNPTYPGYMFEGWYLDKTCTAAANFNKMPAGSITVFAKWQRIQYRVYLHANEGTLPPGQDPDFRIDQGDMISNGEEIQVTREGYELVGWYTDSELHNAFNFNTKLNDDTAGMQDYPLTGRTDDVGRYWVTGKFHLYAKWRKVLPGASGLTVLYNAVSYIQSPGNSVPGHYEESVIEWTDPLPYTDGAYAIGRTASSPDSPDDYVFLYYEIMNADGTPSGKRVYPGQNYVVDFDDAVVSDVPSSGSKGVPSSGTRAAGSTYELVTTAPSDWSGNYVITYGTNTSMYVLKGVTPSSNGASIESTSNRSSYSASGISLSGTRLTNVGDAYVFTIAAQGSYYSVKSVSTGTYLGMNGTYFRGYTNYNSSYCRWTPGSGTNASGLTCQSGDYPYLSFYTSSNYFWAGSSLNTNIRLWKEVNSTTYTVTFTDWDGTVITSVEVAEGGSATPPADPTREGYNFIGWSGTYTDVHQNEVVTATYEKDTTSGTEVWAPVTSIEPGEEYLIGVISNGNVYLLMSNNPDTSTMYASLSLDGYTHYCAYAIKGIRDSSDRVTAVSNDTILTAGIDDVKWVFTAVTGGYHIQATKNSQYLRTYSTSNDYYDCYPGSATNSSLDTWSWNGTNLTLTISGSTKYIGALGDATTGQINYFDTTFTSSNAMTIQLYKKQFIANVDTYTVKFYGWEGAELDSQTVEEGSCATAPADPTHDGYIFSGWAKDGDDTTLYTKAQVDAMPITADTTFTAHYTTESGKPVYTVTFVNWNGNVLKTTYVEEGSGTTAPSVPAREGYTFTGWDTYAWENNVTEDMIVTANFQKTVTKQYTVTLRAVYGPKAVLKYTHITWHANNGTGDYQHSVDVIMNEDIPIEYPANNGRDGESDVEVFPKLEWENHVFLGWARLPISDMNGNINADSDPESASYDTYKEVDETDLFLKYVPAADGVGNGSFYAKADDGQTWRKVDYVAADELMPYHGMYAVWANEFKIYHSGVGEDDAVETVVTTAGIKDPNATFDLLEGVNMRSEVNGAVTIDAFSTTKVRGVSSNSLYGGYYLEADAEHDISGITLPTRVNGKLPAYDGTNWIWTNPQLVSAKAMKPEAGQTYYIKEVPADKFLQSYIHYTYYGLMEGEGNDAHLVGTGKIGSLFAISDIDDLMYRETGFIVKSAKAPKVHIVKSMTIQPQNHPENYATLTPEDVFHVNGDRNYLTYSILYNVVQIEGETNVVNYGEDFTVSRYWKTPDNLFVTGIVNTAYSGMGNVTTLTATNETVPPVISETLNTAGN
ncbi:MAG: InlB B-repeat-containing protein [Clostridia bacterium]|nr:InlB B-repeat-containing protein [Clostridia bacterium]